MYDPPTDAQIAHYRERGWLAVEDAVAPADLEVIRRHVVGFTEDPVAVRAAMPHGEAIVQGMLELVWIAWRDTAWHRWTHAFCEGLQERPIDFWYNQLLIKPPRIGLATGWHQDEAFFGNAGPDLLISAWLTLDDVDPDSGCMHFEDGGHKAGIRRVFGVDGSPEAAAAAIDPARVVAAPLRAGGMTFHSGKTPHMTLTNRSERWRNVVIQRFTIRGVQRPWGH